MPSYRNRQRILSGSRLPPDEGQHIPLFDLTFVLPLGLAGPVIQPLAFEQATPVMGTVFGPAAVVVLDDGCVVFSQGGFECFHVR